MSIDNKIRELRTAAGLTAEALALRVGTSQVQISRLERGERKLTLEWMMRLAKALECAPEDLLGPVNLGSFEDPATPYISADSPDITAALARQNQILYAPNSNALEGLGFGPSDPVLFDMSADACAKVKTGDVVIVHLVDKTDTTSSITLARQFIAPDLFTTNRRGRNFSFHTDEEQFTAEIQGVHRYRDGSSNAS